MNIILGVIRMEWRKIRRLSIIVVTMIFFTLPLWGQESQEALKKIETAHGTWYVNIFFPYRSIGGDKENWYSSNTFDGESVLYATDYNGQISEIILVPKFESGRGIGISLGLQEFDRIGRWIKGGDVEVLGILRSNHDAVWGANTNIYKTKASYTTIESNIKFLLSNEPNIIYIFFGIPWLSWLTVEDASFTGDYKKVGDATFRGGFLSGIINMGEDISGVLNFNIGGGLKYQISPKVSIDGMVGYSTINYGYAKGVEGKMMVIKEPITPFSEPTAFGASRCGTGYNMSLGLTYHFMDYHWMNGVKVYQKPR